MTHTLFGSLLTAKTRGGYQTASSRANLISNALSLVTSSIHRFLSPLLRGSGGVPASHRVFPDGEPTASRQRTDSEPTARATMQQPCSNRATVEHRALCIVNRQSLHGSLPTVDRRSNDTSSTRLNQHSGLSSRNIRAFWTSAAFRRVAAFAFVLLLSIGQMWGAVNKATTPTTIIYTDAHTGSSDLTLTNNTEDNGFLPISGTIKLKKPTDQYFSIAQDAEFAICVDNATAGTIFMAMDAGLTWAGETSKGSNSRYCQLFIDTEGCSSTKWLFSKYNATVDGTTKGPRSFAFTATDLTEISGKKYLKFKAIGGEMKPYGFKIEITSSSGDDDDDDCTATADAGADKTTTVNTGVQLGATAAASGFTGAWSIKSGSPSTATSQFSSTSSATATFTPTAEGTYTLIWTVTNGSDATCTASDEITVTVSKEQGSGEGEGGGTTSEGKMYYWFVKADDATTNEVTQNEDNFFSNAPTGNNSYSDGAQTIAGTDYTISKRSGNTTATVTFTIPTNKKGVLYAVMKGNGTRKLSLQDSNGTEIEYKQPSNDVFKVYEYSTIPAGSYRLVATENVYWAMLAVKVTDAISTDATLKEIKANGQPIAGFDASLISYTVYVQSGSDIPTISATANDTKAKSVNITQATSIPGSATIVVTAEDNTTTKTYTVKFEYMLYTVKFDAQNGTEITSIKQESAGAAIILPSPSRTGYELEGWYKGDEKIEGTTYTPTENNVTLTAHWTPINYNITYVLEEGATNSSSNPAKYTIETEDITLAPASKANAGFVGWFDNNGQQVTTIAKGSTGNITLTAQFASVYNYSYSSAIGELPTQPTEPVAAVTLPDMAAVTGHTFKGWTANQTVLVNQEEKTAGTLLVAGTSVQLTAETQFTAQWETNKHKVTFDVAGGSDIAEMTNIEYNSNVDLSDKTPTKNGNRFNGWTSTDVTIENNAFTMPDKDVTITATWQPETYEITYDLDEGSWDGTEGQGTYTYGTEYTLPTNVTKQGYIFVKWQKNGSDISKITSTTYGDVEVKAIWEAIKYAKSVDFAAEAAGNKTAIATLMSNANYTSTLTTDNKGDYDTNGLYTGFKVKTQNQYFEGILQQGYIFSITFGYVETGVTITVDNVAQTFTTSKTAETTFTYAAETKDVVIHVTNNSANSKTTTLKVISVTANVPHTVSFNTHAAEEVSPLAETATGEGIQLPTAPSKQDYFFEGWYTQETGGTFVGNGGETYHPTEDCTLHAHWTTYANTVDFMDAAKRQNPQPKVADFLAANNYTVTPYGDVQWDENEYDHTDCGLKFESKTDDRDFSFWVRADYDVIIQLGAWLGHDDNLVSTGTADLYMNDVKAQELKAQQENKYTTTEDTKFVIKVVDPYWSVIQKITIVPTTYTVSFDANGHGSAPSSISNIAKNATITEPTAPIVTGYTFGGWYTDKACPDDKKWDFSTSTVTANTILYAKWTAKTTEITLDANGGKTNGFAVATYDSKDLTDYSAAVGQDGQSLLGYFDAQTDGNKMIDAQGFLMADKWSSEEENVTYYAQWKATANKYKINYAEIKDADMSAYPEEYEEGIGIESFAPLADTKDFHFTGWSPASISAETTGEQTITAQWEEKYSVTYNAGAGSNPPTDNTKYYQGQTVTLASAEGMTAPARKAFDKWQVKDANGVEITISDDGKTFVMPAGNVNVTATWLTVIPKDGTSIIKATYQNDKEAKVEGLYAGTASVNLKSQKLDKGEYYFYITLDGTTLLATDVLKVNLVDQSSVGNKTLDVYCGVGELSTLWQSIATNKHNAGDNTYTLTGLSADMTSIGFKRTDNTNNKINSIEILRPMNPILMALTIDGVSATINKEAKTIEVELMHGTNPSEVEFVPTILANDDAEHQASAALDGTLAYNTPTNYVVTDKDGDQTTYVLTATEQPVSDDATLQSITVGDINVPLQDGQSDYIVTLPNGTESIPQITIKPNHGHATAVMTPQTPTFADQVTIVVTAEDETTTKTYTLRFNVSPYDTSVSIFDGSTMSAIADSPENGLTWSVKGANSTNGTGCTIEGGNKTYTKYVNLFTSTTSASDHYLKVVVPEGYFAVFTLAAGSNSSGERSMFIATEAKGSSDGSIVCATATSSSTGYVTSTEQPAGPYYLCATASTRLYELTVLLRKTVQQLVDDEGTNEINILNDYQEEDLTIAANQNVTINGNGHKIGNLTVENGGKLTLSGKLSVDNFIIEADQANHKSGQLKDADKLTIEGTAYMDLSFAAHNAVTEGWYAFTVPFKVSSTQGIYNVEGNVATKLTNETDYAIMQYQGDVRAQGKYGWIKTHKMGGMLQPGMLYIIAFGDTDYDMIRFVKASGDLKTKTVAISEFGGGADTDNGWNGVGNPTLAYGNAENTGGATKAQFLNHDAKAFEVSEKLINEQTYIVSSAFFIQANSDDVMTFAAPSTNGNLYAPRRAAAEDNSEFMVELSQNGKTQDRFFLSASEEASATYEIGHDLVKMGAIDGAAKVAQVAINGYGMSLCDAEFVLDDNNEAFFPLTITAPKAGEYTLSIKRACENQSIFVMDGNQVVWDLTQGDYTFSVAKGTSSNYGLLLQAAERQMPTGNQQLKVNGEGVQKIILHDALRIIKNGKMYNVLGL